MAVGWYSPYVHPILRSWRERTVTIIANSPSSSFAARRRGTVRRGREAFAAIMLLLAAVPAAADAQRYRVDAAGSRVDFRIRYLGLFNPGGQFHDVTGTVLFDPDDWQTLAVAIRIPVNSLEAHPAFWHDEILGPNFFDEAQHPAILFTSTGVERTGEATAAVNGQLTLRAATLPVVLAARIAPDARGIEIDADAKISRAAFGLTGTLRLGSDEVTVSLHLRVVPAVDPAAEARP